MKGRITDPPETAYPVTLDFATMQRLMPVLRRMLGNVDSAILTVERELSSLNGGTAPEVFDAIARHKSQQRRLLENQNALIVIIRAFREVMPNE